MVRLYGSFLTQNERKFLRHGIKYTLDYLLPGGQHKRARINVYIKPFPEDEEQSDAMGTCELVRDEQGRRTCNIWVHRELIKDRSTNWMKFNDMLYYLFHELVHVKQYLSGELKDIDDDQKYVFRGRVYKNPKPDDEDGYYTQPHEIEAYGKQQHLVARFHTHLVEKKSKLL